MAFLRCGSVRFYEIGNLTVRFGSVFGCCISYGAVRCCGISCGAVQCCGISCGAVRCCFEKMTILRCGSVRFSKIAKFYGAVRCFHVSYVAVRCFHVSYAAVRCVFRKIRNPTVQCGAVRCGFEEGENATVRFGALRTDPHRTDRKNRTVKKPDLKKPIIAHQLSVIITAEMYFFNFVNIEFMTHRSAERTALSHFSAALGKKWALSRLFNFSRFWGMNIKRPHLLPSQPPTSTFSTTTPHLPLAAIPDRST